MTGYRRDDARNDERHSYKLCLIPPSAPSRKESCSAKMGEEWGKYDKFISSREHVAVSACGYPLAATRISLAKATCSAAEGDASFSAGVASATRGSCSPRAFSSPPSPSRDT